MAKHRRVPLGAKLAISLLIGSVALWSLGWFITVSQAERALAQWRIDTAAAGAALTCVDETSGGYPFRMLFDCTDPVIEITAGSETYVATGTTLRVVSQIYDTDHMIVEIDGPFAIARRDPTPQTVASVGEGAARASVELSGGKLQRLSVTLPPFAALVPAGGGTWARLDLDDAAFHLRARVSEHDYDVAVRGKRMTVLAQGAPDEDAVPIDAFDLIAIVNKVPSTGLAGLAGLLRQWRDNGGVADIQRLSFDSPALASEAKGTMEIGPDGRIEGALNGSFQKVEKFIEALRHRGMIDDNEAQLSLGAIGIFGTRPDGTAGVALPIRIREGDVYLGPVKIATVPPLI